MVLQHTMNNQASKQTNMQLLCASALPCDKTHRCDKYRMFKHIRSVVVFMFVAPSFTVCLFFLCPSSLVVTVGLFLSFSFTQQQHAHTHQAVLPALPHGA